MLKIGWLVGDYGHSRSSKMSPFNTAHMTSYLSKLYIFPARYRFRDIAYGIRRDVSNSPTVYLPHLHLEWPCDFHQDLWQEKTRISMLWFGFVCIILPSAVLIARTVTTGRLTSALKEVASRGRSGVGPHPIHGSFGLNWVCCPKRRL